MPGRLVYVMGPSGAGKDTLLAYARRRVAGSDIVFAHRYITRMPLAGDENFISLAPDEFMARRIRGFFLFDWAAHGICYGIGQEIRLWQEHCALVIVSGSRAHYAAAQPAEALPLVITARPEIIAQRLAARGREDASAAAARLARAAPIPSDARVIDNSGELEAAGEQLVDLLKSLSAETAHAR